MKLLEIIDGEYITNPNNCVGCGCDLPADVDTINASEFCIDCQADGVDQYECEVVFVDENGEILTEAAKRMFKRIGKEIKRRYRCTTGPKKGKPVSDPKLCATRKDPRKVRHGRKVARTKKGIRIRKSKIMKRTAMSKMVRRMNQRLSSGQNKPKASTKSPSTTATKKPTRTKKSATTKAMKTKKTK